MLGNSLELRLTLSGAQLIPAPELGNSIDLRLTLSGAQLIPAPEPSPSRVDPWMCLPYFPDEYDLACCLEALVQDACPDGKVVGALGPVDSSR